MMPVISYISTLSFVLTSFCASTASLSAVPQKRRDALQQQHSWSLPVDLPNVTSSGYLKLSEETKDALFYAYYEAQEANATDRTPILLWLEVDFSLSSCYCSHDNEFSAVYCLDTSGRTPDESFHLQSPVSGIYVFFVVQAAALFPVISLFPHEIAQPRCT
jgi:hypothetical protein